MSLSNTVYSNTTNSNINTNTNPNVYAQTQSITKYYMFNDDYDKYISKTNNSIENQVVESNNILNREYTLLFIWFMIAIIILIITTVGILSNEMNIFVLYPTLGFFIFIMFYIFKNIYIYFNEFTPDI
jgi:hypothetical protein